MQLSFPILVSFPAEVVTCANFFYIKIMELVICTTWTFLRKNYVSLLRLARLASNLVRLATPEVRF